MSVIIISRLTCSLGSAVAAAVASRLGYSCIDREVFEEASRRSHIPLDKLRKPFFKAPSIFGISTPVMKRYAVHVGAALARRCIDDDIVYHGPFGHLLIRGISHVAAVRIRASREDRIKRMIELKGCNSRTAEKEINRSDKYRLSLAETIFRVNDDDPGLFNLTIDTSAIDIETAAGNICEESQKDRYRSMTWSLEAMANLELEYRIRESIVNIDPDASVYAKQGDVRIRIRVGGRSGDRMIQDIRSRTETFTGVQSVNIETITPPGDQL